MMQTYKTGSSIDPGTVPPEFGSSADPLTEAVSFIRRHLRIMLLTFFVTVGVALLYLVAAVPTFTATSKLVIDAKAPPTDAASASTMVESQIAIIKSEGLARVVIRKLGLAEDPEFGGRSGGLRGMIKSIFQLVGLRKPETEFNVMRRALQSFDRKLSARRLGLTYIVEMTFDSIDPERAAKILNTVAETHIAAQMEAKFKSGLRDEQWVKDRMTELTGQASAAQKAVADYQAVDTGKTAKVQGDLRELEANAETSAKAYDNFLRMLRYMEAQQQSSNIEAHLLIEASRPLDASSPKVVIVLGISLVGGVLFGIAIGFLRDLLGWGIRTSGDDATASSVVVLQQGEASVANQNHAPAALSPLRR